MPCTVFVKHATSIIRLVPVPQRQGRVHLCGHERLRLIDQRRHPLHEIATFGADRLRDRPERRKTIIKWVSHRGTNLGFVRVPTHGLILVLTEVELLLRRTRS